MEPENLSYSYRKNQSKRVNLQFLPFDNHFMRQNRIILVFLALFAVTLQAGELKKFTKPSFIISEVEKRYGLDIKRKQNNLVLYQQILLWEGTPYQYSGNSKNGIDCSGLVGRLFRKAYKRNIAAPSSVLYSRSRRISRKSLKEGDLVFFNIAAGKISHVGIYLKDGKFVHASTKRGVIVSSLDEKYYTRYFVSGGRI